VSAFEKSDVPRAWAGVLFLFRPVHRRADTAQRVYSSIAAGPGHSRAACRREKAFTLPAAWCQLANLSRARCVSAASQAHSPDDGAAKKE
jgi:hypothetical protein